LRHARDEALAGQLAELVAAQLELAVITSRTPGQLTAVAHASLGRIAWQLRQLHLRLEAHIHGLRAILYDRLQRRALVLVAQRHSLPPLVLLDRTGLGHLTILGPICVGSGVSSSFMHGTEN